MPSTVIDGHPKRKANWKKGPPSCGECVRLKLKVSGNHITDSLQRDLTFNSVRDPGRVPTVYAVAVHSCALPACSNQSQTFFPRHILG